MLGFLPSWWLLPETIWGSAWISLNERHSPSLDCQLKNEIKILFYTSYATFLKGDIFLNTSLTSRNCLFKKICVKTTPKRSHQKKKKICDILELIGLFVPNGQTLWEITFQNAKSRTRVECLQDFQFSCNVLVRMAALRKGLEVRSLGCIIHEILHTWMPATWQYPRVTHGLNYKKKNHFNCSLIFPMVLTCECTQNQLEKL